MQQQQQQQQQLPKNVKMPDDLIITMDRLKLINRYLVKNFHLA